MPHRARSVGLLRPPIRAARAIGDSLAVVRYGTGAARLRRPALQAHLEIGLGAVLAVGWRLQRVAIRRRLNQEADALATEGHGWARFVASVGALEVQTRVSWLPGSEALIDISVASCCGLL